MLIKFELVVDEVCEEDVEKTFEALRTILRRTADYQHGNLLMDRAVGYNSEDIFNIQLYTKYCEDLAHTRDCMKDFFVYLQREFV